MALLLAINCLTVPIPEFQKLPGRTPWLRVAKNNDAHIVKKCQVDKYTLQDPSRMSQQAVIAYLSHWYKRQEADKDAPLKFLNPPGHVFEMHDNITHEVDKVVGDKDNDNDGRKDNEEGETSQERHAAKGKHVVKPNAYRGERKKDDVAQSVNASGENISIAMEDQEGGGRDVDEGKNKFRGRPAANKKREANQGGAEWKKKKEDPLPITPAEVDPELRKAFLKSLSNDKQYQKLVGLLDTANVSIIDLFCYLKG